MKKLLSLLYNFLIGGLSIVTALRYWLLNLHGLDLITSVLLLLIAFAGFGKIYLGWEFPILNNFPRLKKILKIIPKSRPERYFNLAENDDFSLIQKLKKIKIERTKKRMKKIGQWLKLNYAPSLSFMAFVLYVSDNHFGWTDKWHLPSEWYYAITAIVIIIVGIGIKSKGFKGITLGELISEVINDFTLQKMQLKQENKQRIDKAKLQMKTQPMVDVLKNSLKEEILKELKGEKPPQTKPLTPEESKAKYGNRY